MNGFWLRADRVLRGGERVANAARSDSLAWLLALVALFGLFYGAVMGGFGGLEDGRALQVAYSAVKVPLLLLLTFGLSLPSFFVLNTLLGVREDFGDVLRALVTTQAGLTILLASLAPFTLVWYASSGHYAAAILFNALMFAAASVGAQGLLRRHYRPLVARNPVHRVLLRVWLVVYAFVGIQMGWMLRPFVGDPGSPVRFFREDVLGNAYVVIAQLVWQVLRS